jgi:hypothetical protein
MNNESPVNLRCVGPPRIVGTLMTEFQRSMEGKQKFVPFLLQARPGNAEVKTSEAFIVLAKPPTREEATAFLITLLNGEYYKANKEL